MLRLNLPPAYMLIHRTWLGGVGVLSQLEEKVPFRRDARGVPARLRRHRWLSLDTGHHHSLSSLDSIARRCSREQVSQKTIGPAVLDRRGPGQRRWLALGRPAAEVARGHDRPA